jgi:ferric-dicitrate binding protein FerR (iron transport regulator)
MTSRGSVFHSVDRAADRVSDRVPSALPNRRHAIGVMLGAAAVVAVGPAAAAVRVGAVIDVTGQGFARLDRVRTLQPEGMLLLGDLVWTASRSHTALGLDMGARIDLGPGAQLVLDAFVAQSQGDLVLNAGAMIFDRDEDLPKVDVTVRSQYGLISVRGTQFFAGPSRGVFGIFVARGAVRVNAGGARVRLTAGEGVDIAAPGDAPSDVIQWGAERIAEAYASVRP